MRTRMARHLDALSALSREAPDQHLQRAATLAGRAATPVDLPPEFSWHDYAIFLLSTAAEIEHSLMVQYLYAAYSATLAVLVAAGFAIAGAIASSLRLFGFRRAELPQPR
jgi:hypothetical protein